MIGDLYEIPSNKYGTLTVLVEGGTILFYGSDVAKALRYSNPSSILAYHCPERTKRSMIRQTGVRKDGDPIYKKVNMTFITEDDLYRLTSHSKYKEAEKYWEWVFDEIILVLLASTDILEARGMSKDDFFESFDNIPKIN